MSLLSSKFVSLALGTRSARASVHSNWSRGQVLARSSHTVNPTETMPAPAADDDPQVACIQAAQAVLSDLNASAGLKKTPLKVQISDALAHFDVVCGDFAESSVRQLQAIANACVNDLLGDHAGPQVVRWQLQADTRHLLIASLQATTVDALVHEAARHEMPLESLQPEFCARWNAYAGARPDASAVFASVADGTVVMALTERGSITALSTGALGEDDGATAHDGAPKTALDLRADRLAASHGLSPADLNAFVLVADQALAASPRWTMVRLQEESA